MANFFLRTTKTQGTANLYVRVQKTSAKINWWVNSRIKVDVQEWTKAQKSTAALSRYYSTPEGKEVLNQMGKIEGIIETLFEEKKLRSDADKDVLDAAIGDVTNADAKKALAEVKKAKEDEEKKKLCRIWDYYDFFFDGISTGKLRTKKGEVYTASSIRIWKRFGEYLKEYTPKEKTFAEINKRFGDGFTLFLESKGLMPKTINKNVLCFRRLCNAAALDEHNTNLVSVKVWTEREVKQEQKRAEIALNDDEIDALYNMKLEGIKEEVRDVFLLGVFSGQRVSDYSNLSKENFKTTPNGTDVIVLNQQKTGKDMVVPILDERVFEICMKYNYNFPKRNFRDIDRYLKEILQTLAEGVPSLNEWHVTQIGQKECQKEQNYLQTKKRVEGGEKLHGDKLKYYNELCTYARTHESGEDSLYKRDHAGRVLKRKWELVGSHTARRTAITSMYNSGLYDSKDIMAVSGHTTLKNYENYIKRESVEQADRIAAKAKKAKMKVKKAE